MKKHEEFAKEKYDYLAEHYHRLRTKDNPQGWFYNEMLEMPATLELLDNVKGKKILDFGCGTGIYAKLLTKKGAKVKGFDISPEMISIAKKENPKLDLRVATGYKFPFKEKFDIILSSLVVHYLEDWDKMFKEVSRVLKKGGDFIFSTGNPIVECMYKLKVPGRKRKLRTLEKNNYFTLKKVKTIWNVDGKEKLEMQAYHRTYESIIKTIVKNGFEIVDYKDCRPILKSKKIFPSHYKLNEKMPYFSVWKVRKK